MIELTPERLEEIELLVYECTPNDGCLIVTELLSYISALKTEKERLRRAARDVLDMLPYKGILDLPELRAVVNGEE